MQARHARIRKPDVRDVSGKVSGVVKTVFLLAKSPLFVREVVKPIFFCPRKTREDTIIKKAKSPLFVREVVKTMFYGEHDENTLFSTENTRDTGHNF